MPHILITREGFQWGPYPLPHVNGMLAAGLWNPDDLAWTEGLNDWVPLAQIPGVVLPGGEAGDPREYYTGATPPPLPGFPADGARGFRPTGSTSTAAVVSLVLGILGLTLGWIFFLGLPLGIAAIVCGHSARGAVKRSQGRLKGRGMALSGLITGYTAVFVPILLAAFAGFMLVTRVMRQKAEQAGLGQSALVRERAAFPTQLLRTEREEEPAETPPPDSGLQLIRYPSPLGRNEAYVSRTVSGGTRLPAIVWLVGGFSNSIGNGSWNPGPRENDQSATAFQVPGLIVMYPSLRGGNKNNGFKEGLFGEVDDVKAAVKWLGAQPGVDPARIMVGGHSTGGTLALLVAENSDNLRAVFAFGPAARVRDYGQNNLPFDIMDAKESDLRSPVMHLETISCPTFIFEGEEGNAESLHELTAASHNPLVEGFLLENQTHFSGLRAISSMLAGMILKDTGATPLLPVSSASIRAALGK